MLLQIATRVHEEEYFIGTFLRYYLRSGVDRIHVFYNDSCDGTLQILKEWCSKTDKVKLVFLDNHFRHTGYQSQTAVCNHILQYALKEFTQTEENTCWMFVDADEFIHTHYLNDLKDLSKYHTNIVRCLFIDWYLSPDLFSQYITSKEMLQLAHNRRLKGKLASLWNDPFYKDYIIYLNQNSFGYFDQLKAVSGFHRFLCGNQPVIPENVCNLVVDHLRGLPRKISLRRFANRLALLQNRQNDWSYVHFQKLQEHFTDYENFYHTECLVDFAKLEEQISEAVDYDNSQSYYNRVIMDENARYENGSQPSSHTFRQNGMEVKDLISRREN